MVVIANIPGEVQWMHGLVLLGENLLSHPHVKMCLIDGMGVEMLATHWGKGCLCFSLNGH